MKKKRRGRPPTKSWQRLRLWRDGKTLLGEYPIDPDQPVVDVEIITGWPSAAPDVHVQVDYPCQRERERP